VDCDADGELDMDAFSPEAAETEDEAVVFRVGAVYVSTRKVDLEKNQITMKSHSASDYKRIELRMGGQAPEIEFTDFNNKKRKLSEFRGKYVLVDFWGMWCPPCRQELTYLRTAYQRFQARGFEIVGMNTDRAELVPQIKAQLEKNGTASPGRKPDAKPSSRRFTTCVFTHTLRRSWSARMERFSRSTTAARIRLCCEDPTC
jgi:hypothetical protein